MKFNNGINITQNKDHLNNHYSAALLHKIMPYFTLASTWQPFWEKAMLSFD